MKTVTKKILLISLFAIFFASSTVVRLTQANQDIIDDSKVKGKSQEALSKGKKYGLDWNWEDFKTHFNKKYESPQQDAFRRAIFQKTKNKLQSQNCEACGLTKFSDLTEAEFQAMLGTIVLGASSRRSKDSGSITPIPTDPIQPQFGPTSFDWRNYDAVTPVKNQGGCGSCWAFSATGFLQSQLIRRGNADKTIDLAEQYMTKCDTTSFGCNGGYPFKAAEFGLRNGLPLQSTYPYLYTYNYPNICTAPVIAKTFNDVAAQVDFYVSGNKDLNNTIKAKLFERPLMLGVNANDWGSYAPTDVSNIYSCKEVNSAGGINHAVLLIGYTADAWIVKNSWGRNWGVDGHIYVTRTPKQNCGIGLYYGWLTNPLTPVV